MRYEIVTVLLIIVLNLSLGQCNRKTIARKPLDVSVAYVVSSIKINEIISLFCLTDLQGKPLKEADTFGFILVHVIENIIG